MKIVFVLGSLQSQRCIKRIRSFVVRGIDVSVFAFQRSSEMYNSEIGFPIEVIGSFSNDYPYWKRFFVLLKSFRRIASTNADLYYLFGLDMALSFQFVCPCRPYVYEESDLVHTYLSNPFARKALECVDKWLIRKSRMTLLTSEGFLRYHYGTDCPGNIRVVPNKLSPTVSQYPLLPKSKHGNLRVGFVGKIRFKTIFSFAEIFCRRYPQHEFHFYGDFPSETNRTMFAPLSKYGNCFFHGSFKNPADLPAIYAEIDWVLSSYDPFYENVRYAEPNKLYEAIFFETPIVVSKGTFLADRVEDLGVGFVVNAMDEGEVVSLVEGWSDEVSRVIRARMQSIPKIDMVDCPDPWIDSVCSV